MDVIEEWMDILYLDKKGATFSSKYNYVFLRIELARSYHQFK